MVFLRRLLRITLTFTLYPRSDYTQDGIIYPSRADPGTRHSGAPPTPSGYPPTRLGQLDSQGEHTPIRRSLGTLDLDPGLPAPATGYTGSRWPGATALSTSPSAAHDHTGLPQTAETISDSSSGEAPSRQTAGNRQILAHLGPTARTERSIPRHRGATLRTELARTSLWRRGRNRRGRVPCCLSLRLLVVGLCLDRSQVLLL